MRAIHLLGLAAIAGGGLYLYSKNKSAPAGTPATKPTAPGTPGGKPVANVPGGGLVVDDPTKQQLPDLNNRLLTPTQADALDSALSEYVQRSSNDVLSSTDIIVRGSPIQPGETVDGADRLSSKIQSFTAGGALVFVDGATVAALVGGANLPMEVKLRFITSDQLEAVKDALLAGWFLYRKPAV